MADLGGAEPWRLLRLVGGAGAGDRNGSGFTLIQILSCHREGLVAEIKSGLLLVVQTSAGPVLACEAVFPHGRVDAGRANLTGGRRRSDSAERE